MTLLCLLSAIAAFLAFGLATEQHYQRRTRGRLLARRKRLFRCWAWLGVAMSLPLALAAEGFVYGGVLWIAALSFGAAISFLVLNFMPDA